MSHKSKGINAERDLVHKFWALGWAVIRVAGSGSSKYPSPDLLAGNGTRRLAIECKVSGASNKYFEGREIEELKVFARTFGAEPWVAVRFVKHDWLFITLDDLKKTDGGFSVSLETIKRRGLLLDEIIK